MIMQQSSHCIQKSSGVLSEKWEESLDNGKAKGIVFIDLTKAFDAVKYNILLFFRFKANHRHQRTKFCSENDTFFLWSFFFVKKQIYKLSFRPKIANLSIQILSSRNKTFFFRSISYQKCKGKSLLFSKE